MLFLIGLDITKIYKCQCETENTEEHDAKTSYSNKHYLLYIREQMHEYQFGQEL